jgi:hypothetical protein
MPTTKTASNTTARRRPSSSVSVQKQSIHQATQHLAQLPEKPRDAWSLREAIEQLKDPIDGALVRGYTHEEIAGILSEKGVKISPSSLKSYLAATRKNTEGKVKRVAKPRAKKASTTEAAPKTTHKQAAPIEVVAPPAETPAEPAPKKRGGRPKSTAAPTKTAAKTRGRAAAKAEKPTAAKAPLTTSTRGRKKKETT